MAYRDDSSRTPLPRSEERRPRSYHIYQSAGEKDVTDERRSSSPRRSRRRRPRKHIVVESEPEADFEDSDDVLDDFYGGNSRASGDDEDDEDDEHEIRPRPPRPSHYRIHDYARPTVNQSYGESYGRPVTGQSNHLSRPPRSYRARGLWTRAVRPSSDGSPFSAHLRLVVTRHGEIYKSRDIPYVKSSWDDVQFARRLKEEYRILKATKIGFKETIASYTKIHFVYFRQYHAYSSRRFNQGKWNVSKLIPITALDDEKAKVWFMYQLQKLSSLRSRWAGAGGRDGRRQSAPRKWTCRLDGLIEPGAVIDMEVLETFDVKRICVGLLLAVLFSLAVALAYGFAVDKDFSTGFSIASWIITAAGFFAAIVALFGDDSSTSLRASLNASPQEVPERFWEDR
ncbi:unnamed protein product [Zymoseptoria tritici ST99CH_1A5]|nr:unnamed protein product [Zymoseptoria tritici ST99CH_3D1]SMY27569.1 unnamed protein product [Zymoseptoria tritici ST99CH_1A5]